MAETSDFAPIWEIPRNFNSVIESDLAVANSSRPGGTGVVYSPLNMPKLKLFVVFIYAFLSLAVVFNLRVIYMVIRILTSTRTQTLARHEGNRHAFVYVLSLSIVDTLVLAHLPLVATDIVLSRWIFGDAMCKLYWLIEQVNRILSTFILTALSADRYLAICHPLKFTRYRTTGASVVVIAICVFLAASLLAPTFVYSHVVEWEVSNHTIAKCMFAMDSETSGRFLSYVFICGYCIPFVSMLFFYSSILRVLWRRQRHNDAANQPRNNNTDNTVVVQADNGSAMNGNLVWTAANMAHHRRHHHRAQHVTQRALVLVAFYFFCWSPYWFVQFVIHFALTENEMMQAADGMIIAIYAVHVLVYLNSAVNPFLYALLNKELQRQHSSLDHHHRNRGERTTTGDHKELVSVQLLSAVNRSPAGDAGGRGKSKSQSQLALNGSINGSTREHSRDFDVLIGSATDHVEPLLNVKYV